MCWPSRDAPPRPLGVQAGQGVGVPTAAPVEGIAAAVRGLAWRSRGGAQLEGAVGALMDQLQPPPSASTLQSVLRLLRDQQEPQKCMAVFHWATSRRGSPQRGAQEEGRAERSHAKRSKQRTVGGPLRGCHQ